MLVSEKDESIYSSISSGNKFHSIFSEQILAPSSRYFSRRPTVGAGRIVKRSQLYRRNTHFRHMMEAGHNPFDQKYFYRPGWTVQLYWIIKVQPTTSNRDTLSDGEIDPDDEFINNYHGGTYWAWDFGQKVPGPFPGRCTLRVLALESCKQNKNHVWQLCFSSYQMFGFRANH